MKCRVCREPAIIDVRRANANFCQDHFVRFCRDQVQRAIDEFEMLSPGDRVLVAPIRVPDRCVGRADLRSNLSRSGGLSTPL